MEVGDMVRAWPILRWGAMALMGAGIVGGSFLALDRFDADARSRDTLHLLDLLDPPPQFGASTETNIHSTKGTKPPSHLALFTNTILRTPAEKEVFGTIFLDNIFVSSPTRQNQI